MCGHERKKQYLYICTQHNVKLQMHHYEQRNIRSWETISIAGNKREENCEIGKGI